MRVLTIGNLWPPASLGGYERTWMVAVDGLRAAGHDVRVLTSDAPAPADNATRTLRMYWRDGEWLKPGFRESWAIERHNARELRAALDGVDVVCFWNLGGLSMSLIRRVVAARVPAVGHVGDGWMNYAPRYDRWSGRRSYRGVHWMFNSAWTAQRSGFPTGDIVHPGIDEQRFVHVPPGPWQGRLAYVGRVERAKGVHVAAAALELLPEATLVVNGPTPDADYLDTLTHPRVRLAHDEPEVAYAHSDAVIFPVEWEEPWGLVPLEAMAVGRPVVATATGGAAEYLRDEENALIVPRGDAAAIAAAVRRLAGDAALRERLVAGGRATAARYPESAFTAAIVAAVEKAARG